jgi:elongation factor P
MLKYALVMINSTDLKNGTTFMQYGKPYQVIKYTLIKMGRGGAVVKVLTRNLESGAVEEKSFSSNTAVDEANTYKRKLQYLYNDGANATFMDPKDFSQVEISLKVLGNDVKYIKEGESIDVLFWDEKALSIALSPSVVMEVVETDPGVKGNSASNMFKSATLENGITTKVPLFVEKGEKIKIDTRTGEYLERANK